MTEPKIPKELDALVDKVLAYRPKPKSKAGKTRKRKIKKLIKEASRPPAQSEYFRESD